MSFTLTDMGAEGFEFRANSWNWKTALEVIKDFDLISQGKIQQMNYNATGVKVEQEDAQRIGEYIRDKLLPKLAPNKRIFSDLSITDEPDDGTFHRDEDEQWKNYSADHDWFKEFSEFCLKSKGFQVF